MTKAEVADLLAGVDTNSNGKIEFPEFLEIMVRVPPTWTLAPTALHRSACSRSRLRRAGHSQSSLAPSSTH